MERGKARGPLSLRRNLWTLASKGNVAANIFLAKNVLGYKDVFRSEHNGPEGGAIQVESRPDLSCLSEAELQQLQVLMDKAQGGE
jgi:hypothetical protein